MNKPKINKCNNYDLETAINEKELNNYEFNDSINDKKYLSDITIDSCIFNNIDFSNIELSRIEIMDTIFNNFSHYND